MVLCAVHPVALAWLTPRIRRRPGQPTMIGPEGGDGQLRVPW
jgi:hypothetical protein